MNTNSLAFRLFTTAAAWVLLVLPVAGAIIYSLYRTEVETSFDRRLSVLLTVILQDGIDHGEDEPGDPKDVGEPLFEITHSGWYWQFKPLDLKPPAPKPVDATKAPSGKAAAEPKIPRTLKSRSLAGADLPLPSEFNIDPNDREIRWTNLEGPLGQWLRVARHRPACGHPVPDPLRPAALAQGGKGARRHPLRRGRAPRCRPAAGDRAAAA
jgi:hypothetical protein